MRKARHRVTRRAAQAALTYQAGSAAPADMVTVQEAAAVDTRVAPRRAVVAVLAGTGVNNSRAPRRTLAPDAQARRAWLCLSQRYRGSNNGNRLAR